MDRQEIEDLVNRYIHAIDLRGPDEKTARELFTDDVVQDFSPAVYTGIEHVAPVHKQFIDPWGPTLHRTTNHLVDIDGDRATVKAKFLATHLHREDDPGVIFHIGGDFFADAVRTPDGWRLSKIGLTVVFTEGDPPSAPQAL